MKPFFFSCEAVGWSDTKLFQLAFFCLCFFMPRYGDAQQVYPDAVQTALAKAGENRRSLEGLLNRYREENMREEYEAACFLIAHMPYYEQMGKVIGGTQRVDSVIGVIDKTYYGLVRDQSAEAQETDPLHAALVNGAQEMALGIGELGLEEPDVEVRDIPDIEALDSAFLARHIENAFSLRGQITSLKSVPFMDFLEYVLPYRAFADYPLVSDGGELGDIFRKYINPQREDSVNGLGACYNRVLWWLRHHGGTYPFETMTGWRELFFTGFHDCVDITNYATQIYRACGVPAVSEFNMAYKIWEGRHYMAALLWRDGKWYSHSPESELPDNSKGFPGCLNLYREHFSLQPNTPFTLHAQGERIPDVFKIPGLEDISRKHLRVGRLILPVPDSVNVAGRNLVYLASFQKGAGILPVTWGLIDHASGSAEFGNVVDGNIYYPVFVDSIGNIRPLACPLAAPFAYFNERLEELPRPTGRMVKTRLYRKYPRKPHLLKLAEEVVGTVVLGSDDASFKMADTLAVITEVPDARWERLALRHKRPYKFYRVRASKAHPHMRLAELQFLTFRERGYGNVTDTIGFGVTDSVFVRLLDEPLNKCNWKKEYDLNVQTAPEAYPDVTLRLKEPQYVDELLYMVKHADNGVKAGHEYVLFAWNTDGWKMVERFTAQADFITPKMPMEVGRIYWLSDVTEGKEELPFLIDENGKQVQPYARVLEYVEAEQKR